MAGPNDNKAYLLTESGERISCLFNPAELTISKSNTWQAAEAKGKNAPDLRFQAGQSGTLTMTLILDTTDDGSNVTVHTAKLLALMNVNDSVQGADPARNAARPPWVEFHWGSLHSFKAVVERLQIRFTFFASNGTPLRAKADIALKQFSDEAKLPLQNPTSHTPTLHRIHHLQGGETLDRIAAHHYGDHAQWRLIAEANGVVDPLRLEPGTALVIPELPGRRRAG